VAKEKGDEGEGVGRHLIGMAMLMFGVYFLLRAML